MICKLALDKRDMDALWQQERVRRANDHDISCTEVNCIDNGFVFTVIGTTGEEYLVEIYEDAGLWCYKNCSCNDNYWRPWLACKHLVYCLRLMGAPDDALEDASWEPDQHDIDEILTHAPYCVGCGEPQDGGDSKMIAIKEGGVRDSQLDVRDEKEI